MRKVLIVEDDEIIASQVAKFLETWQMKGILIEDFEKVMEKFEECNPDVVLMDLNLPSYNGFYWCSEIRKKSQVPLIFLSSADDNMNIVMAMNMGADDFISKPFDFQVLMAKIQAIMRRCYGDIVTVHEIEVGKVKLNLDNTTVLVGDTKIELTKNEYLILKTLMEKSGKVVSREKIMEILWGDDQFVDDNTLTVNITRIRKKIEAAGILDFITTKRGIGYIVGQ